MNKQAVTYGILGIIIGGSLMFAINPSIPSTKNVNDQPSQSIGMKHGRSMTMDDMNNTLLQKTGDDFDKAFISGMIEHHQGAIDMANQAKLNAKHDEIKTMADDIISAQSKEIEMMQKWQKDWGY